jgi:hypothetical protein
MEIGSKFKKVSSGEIFTVVEYNDRFKQVIVKGPDGTTVAYSSTTLKDKRRFVPVIEDDTEEFEADGQAIVDSIKEKNQASDREAEEAVNGKKKSSKKTGTRVTTGVGFDIKDLIVEKARSMGADICVATSGKFISFKVNGKMFAAIFSFSKKAATLGVRSSSVEGYQPTKIMNHMMDYRFTFNTISDENKELIDNLLKLSMDYQLNKTNKGGH